MLEWENRKVDLFFEKHSVMYHLLRLPVMIVYAKIFTGKLRDHKEEIDQFCKNIVTKYFFEKKANLLHMPH